MELQIVQDSLDDFINLPYALNRNNKLWAPPLKKDEKALLAPGQHPFWQTARRRLFLARENGRIVGRAAAIIDEKANEWAGEKAGAFGFFECENNQDAANLLLNGCRDWLGENGATFMRGPLNPSTNYTCGMLVSGFGVAPALMMPWNPHYYPELVERWGMRKERDMFAYLIEKKKMDLAPWIKDELNRVKAEGKFTCRHSGKKTLAQDVRAMLRIYRESWAENWGFSPLSDAEADVLVKELTAILDPEFFILFFHEDQPVAGMVALPDLNPLLRAVNGKLGISVLWHYFRLRKEVRKGYRIMLFGILPPYRLQGLPMLLLDRMLALAASKPGLEWVEGSWVLEDNAAIDELIEDFGGQIAKRYRIYRRDFMPC